MFTVDDFFVKFYFRCIIDLISPCQCLLYVTYNYDFDYAIRDMVICCVFQYLYGVKIRIHKLLANYSPYTENMESEQIHSPVHQAHGLLLF